MRPAGSQAHRITRGGIRTRLSWGTLKIKAVDASWRESLLRSSIEVNKINYMRGFGEPQSRRLQYAMRERLEQLGWEQIEVIDEDLGRSAAGGVERHGFERMVAEVCLGKVGAVAA